MGCGSYVIRRVVGWLIGDLMSSVSLPVAGVSENKEILQCLVRRGRSKKAGFGEDPNDLLVFSLARLDRQTLLIHLGYIPCSLHIT